MRDGSWRKQSQATSKDSPLARNRAARRCQRIDRIAGGRRQHQIAGDKRRGPISSGLELRRRRSGFPLPRHAGSTRAQQMRKALQISRLFQMLAAHHRRKPQDFGIAARGSARSGGQSVDDLLEQRGARVNSVDAHRHATASGRSSRAWRARRARLNAMFMDRCLPMPKLPCGRINRAGIPEHWLNIEALATLARIRSLLIMIGDDSMSRR